MTAPVNHSNTNHSDLNLSDSLNIAAATVHYSVTADDHPGALPRVLELFSLRNITPEKVRVHRYKQKGCLDGLLSIDIHVTGLSQSVQEIILHKLANQVSVQNVRDEILFQKRETVFSKKTGQKLAS